MKKMLRTLVAVLIMVMMLSMLGGCGGDKNANRAVEDDESEPYNIRWYFITGNNSSDIQSVQDEMNKYLTEKINATVELIPLDWASYEQKMNTITASNEQFDLCFTSNWIFDVSNNINRGAFYPLNDLVDKHAPGVKEIIVEYNLESIKIAAGDADKVGNYYYIPTVKDWAESFGFVFRKDLVEKYNIDYQNIKSIDELIPALNIIKENEPDVIPFSIGGTSSPIYLLDIKYLGYPVGYYVGRDYGKMVVIPEIPEYKEACKQTRMLVEKGYAPNDAIVADTKNMRKAGDFFCWIEQLKPGKAQELGDDYMHEYVQTMVTRPVQSGLAGAAMAISRTSKNPVRVMKFVELFYTDPYLSNLFAFGIEGKHYEKISDTQIRINADAGYSRSGIQWMFGDTTKNLLLENEDPNKNKLLVEFNNEAFKPPYSDLKVDISELKTQLATCSNVRSEFEGLLLAGAVNVDEELPKFIAKLKQSGSDKIIDAYKAAAEEWLEKHPEYAEQDK